MKVIIQIESCKDCKNCLTERDYTSDSWEMCFRWDCKLADKNIRRYVEWHDDLKYIPDWCPLLSKTEVIKRKLNKLDEKD